VRCKPVGMTNQIVQAASPPALAKNARTGHPLFRNRKGKPGKLGHPPVELYRGLDHNPVARRSLLLQLPMLGGTVIPRVADGTLHRRSMTSTQRGGSVRIAFYLGMVFIWLPLLFLASEFRATSVQNGLSFPQFSVLNNIAVIAVEVAGITMVLGAVSRPHWVISSISVISTICGVLMILGLFLFVRGKLGAGGPGF
jgi:hypothetical protein